MTNQSARSERGLTTRTVWILTAGAFFAFFVFGFVDNLKGPVLPVLLRDLDFSYSMGGTLLLGAYFGFLIATLLTGGLADQVGNKAILAAAGFLLTAGVLLFSLSATFLWLTSAMVLIGLGMGAIEVGGNPGNPELVAIAEELLAVDFAPLPPPKSAGIDVDPEAAKAHLAELPLDEIPAIAPLPVGSHLPYAPNPYFTGRQQELKDLAAALKGGEDMAIGQPQLAGATGMGGYVILLALCACGQTWKGRKATMGLRRFFALNSVR